jgi:F-box and leucine-rich repeat protein 15
MGEVNLLDLVYSDTFCDIQKYLGIRDLFNLRSVSVDFRDYVNREISKLKRITLPKSHETIVNSFEVLCDNCCSLEVINLNHNDWLTDEILSKLLERNSKTLKTLSLNSCNNLSSVGLQPAIINCKRLKKLSLHSCYWLTVGCIEAIAFHHENLEDLDLSNCLISERCLVILLNKFRNLKVLSLSSITTVNDNILFNISMFLNEIKHLNLFGCFLITDRGIGALSLNCKNLESLSVRGCANVSERSLNLLRSRNVHIDVPRSSFQSYMQNIRRQQIHQVRNVLVRSE